MKRRDFLEKRGLSRLKLKVGFLEGEFAPRDPDRAAAWELYIELPMAEVKELTALEVAGG